MVFGLSRQLWKNLGTLLLAFVLAVAVWVSAVLASDPNQTQLYASPIPLEVIGQDPDLRMVGSIPSQVRVQLSAPESLWDALNSQPELIQAWVDFSNLSAGVHDVLVEVKVAEGPVRIIEVLPASIRVDLQTYVTKELTIESNISIEPAPGFQGGVRILSADSVDVSGASSLVEQVERVVVELALTDVRESISESIPLQALDSSGQQVFGVDLEPESVMVTQAILQSSGYRDVAVKVETIGQPTSGYRVTNISVSPPTVTISSSDLELIDQLPGFVSTQPLDLSEANDDIEVRLALDLPEGVTVVGEQSVLVLVGIAAIESSVQVSVPVEVRGITAGLQAVVSPENVELILSGPLPILEALVEEDVRLFVNLANLSVGTHQVVPEPEILPERVEVVSVNPETVEVVISVSLTPSPTADPSGD